MLKSAGTLESIKKGLYIAGSGLHSARPESSLMANHILGPNYVSMDTALAFYGLVPERM